MLQQQLRLYIGTGQARRLWALKSRRRSCRRGHLARGPIASHPRANKSSRNLSQRKVMNETFHELAKQMCESGWQLLICAAVAISLASPIRAEDLYVSATAASNGDGSAAKPYSRITAAV